MRQRLGCVKAPWGLLGMLVLIAGCETFVAGHEHWFHNMVASNWKFCRDAARVEAPDCAVLCLGSSLVKYGTIPRVIEERTGLRTYNLALCGGRMPATYYLLRHALDAGARPKALVLDCLAQPDLRAAPAEQDEELRTNRRNWPDLLDLSDGLELAWTARDGEFLTTLVLARALPSYKLRHDIRRCLQAPLARARSIDVAEYYANQRNWRVNRGAHLVSRTASFPPRGGPLSGANARRGLEVGRLTRIYTQRLLDLAADHQVAVFWLLPPLRPDRAAESLANGMDDFAFRLARDARERSPNVIVLDARRSAYPATNFCDRTHLRVSGALTLSTEVALVVRRALDDPDPRERWVVLPPFREHRSGSPLEDIEHSMVAPRMVLKR